MAESLSQSDREFLRELQGAGPSSIPQLCDLQGVTTTAVRHRLSRLQAAGLVVRESIRTQRGRPHHVYCLTVEGKKLLGDNYTELATILWNQLRRLEDPTTREQVTQLVKQALVEKYGRSVDAVTPAERLVQLQKVLQEHGFHVEAQTSGERLVLTEQNCPYHDLASNDHSICDLEQQVFGQILGVPLQLIHRCVDGHTHCRFEEVSHCSCHPDEPATVGTP